MRCYMFFLKLLSLFFSSFSFLRMNLLVEFLYFVFTRMPCHSESYRRRLRCCRCACVTSSFGRRINSPEYQIVIKLAKPAFSLCTKIPYYYCCCCCCCCCYQLPLVLLSSLNMELEICSGTPSRDEMSNIQLRASKTVVKTRRKGRTTRLQTGSPN